MKLATWNVNSLAVRLPQVLDWLAAHPVDVLVPAGNQAHRRQVSARRASRPPATSAQWFGQKTYNGVALLAREPLPTDVVRNIPGFDDEQARVIAAHGRRRARDRRLLPERAGAGQRQVRLQDALARRAARLGRATNWQRHPQLVLMGDYNIAPEDRDVHDPVAWAGQIHCTPEERAHFQRLRRARPARRLPAVRAAAEELELVGLPQARRSARTRGCASTTSWSARRCKPRVQRLHHRQAAAQERTAERPRAGGRRAAPHLIAARLRSAAGSIVQPEFLDLARDGVAADAELLRRLDAPAAGDLERGVDQLRLELARQRVPHLGYAGSQQRCAPRAPDPPASAGGRAGTTADAAVGRLGHRRSAARRSRRTRGAPASARAPPPRRRRRRQRRSSGGRSFGFDHLRRRHHGQPVADVLELAHVAGKVEAASAAPAPRR